MTDPHPARARRPLARVFFMAVASATLVACSQPPAPEDADASTRDASDVSTDLGVDRPSPADVLDDMPSTDIVPIDVLPVDVQDEDTRVVESGPDAPAPAFTLQILHASDQEAGLGALDDAPRFSAVLRALEQTMPGRTLKLTNGDLWLPGVFYNAGGDPALNALPQIVQASPGRADIAMLNEMGWHAASFGNHEFDNGPREVANIIVPTSGGDAGVLWSGAKFVYLSANLDFSGNSDLRSRVIANDMPIDPASSAAHGRISASAIFTVDGQRVGVVGATTPLLPQISRPETVVTRPSNAMDYAMLASIIQARVDALASVGVNKIIVMAHMQQFNIEADELAPRLRDVDVIIAGGNHSVFADDDDTLRAGDTRANPYPLWRTNASGEPVAVLNTGANYRYVGRFTARFDARGALIRDGHDPRTSGSYATDEAGVLRLGAAAMVDPEVRAIAEAVRSVINTKDGVIVGRTSVYLNGLRSAVRTEETNFGSLTADANLWAAREGVMGRSDSTVLISLKNGGGIRDSIGTVGARRHALVRASRGQPCGRKARRRSLAARHREQPALQQRVGAGDGHRRAVEDRVRARVRGGRGGGDAGRVFRKWRACASSTTPRGPRRCYGRDASMPLVATAGERVRSLVVQLAPAWKTSSCATARSSARPIDAFAWSRSTSSRGPRQSRPTSGVMAIRFRASRETTRPSTTASSSTRRRRSTRASATSAASSGRWPSTFGAFILARPRTAARPSRRRTPPRPWTRAFEGGSRHGSARDSHRR
jgi:2',3'-cyclic-nucleotide 2'-phosphodiesterase (5'-nucleotidase family)